MIRLSKIDEKLSIYKNAKIIILFGSGSAGQRLYCILEYFGIEVDFFTDNNPKKWNQTVNNKKIISPMEVQGLYNNNSDVLVQIASTYSSEIAAQLETLRIQNYIDYFEARARLGYIKLTNILDGEKDLPDFFIDEYLKAKEYIYKKKYYDDLMAATTDTVYIQCQPMKTGNFTINNSLMRENIFLVFCTHLPRLIDLSFLRKMGFKKIRLITSVRDPISQNLSSLFQILSQNSEVIFQYLAQSETCLGGDVQKAFEAVVESRSYFEFKNNLNTIGKKITSKTFNTYLIQDFLEEFRTHLFDLTKVPFDKEKGYQIIKNDDIEIFVYQLEKLNQISKELFAWAGCDKAKLINSNLASEKWVKNVYERSKVEIRFPKEYFDKCYNEPYIRHFYSEKDIIKFKEKWKNNILL